MLVDPVAAVVVRCAECGKLSLISESLFGLKGRIKEVRCGCGHPLVKIGVIKRRSLLLEIMCFLCEEWHQLALPVSIFLGKEEETFPCPESGLELVVAGPVGLLRDRLAAGNLEIMGLKGDLDLEEYFTNPDVMVSILNYLYQLSYGGKVSCRCGKGEIHFNLYEEQIELYCCRCGAFRLVPAASPEDLERVYDLVEIKLNSNLYVPHRFGEPSSTRKDPRKY